MDVVELEKIWGDPHANLEHRGEIAHCQNRALEDASPQLKAVGLPAFLRSKNGLPGNARAGSFHNQVRLLKNSF